MARLTADDAEIQHLKDIAERLIRVALKNAGKVKLTLDNGGVRSRQIRRFKWRE